MGVMPGGAKVDPWSLAQEYLKRQDRNTGMMQYMMNQQQIAEGRNANAKDIATMKEEGADARASARLALQRENMNNRYDLNGIEQRAEARARGIANGKGFGGSGGGLTNTKAINTFINTLRENGVNNQYALAAIAAHIQSESGGDPASFVQNDNGGPSGGLLNWHDGKDSDRYSGLVDFAKKSGGNPNDPRMQALYFLQEGAGPEKPNFARLMNARNYDEANGAMVSIQRFNQVKLPNEVANRRALTMKWGGRLGLPVPTKSEMARDEFNSQVASAAGGQTDEPGVYKDESGRRFRVIYPKASYLDMQSRAARRAGEEDLKSPTKTWRYTPAYDLPADKNSTVAYRMWIDPPGAATEKPVPANDKQKEVFGKQVAVEAPIAQPITANVGANTLFGDEQADDIDYVKDDEEE